LLGSFSPHQPPIGKADILPTADDDVIENADAHQFAGFAQAGGDFQVFAAGGGITGGVVVDEQDGRCRFSDDRGEDFAGMDDTGGETSFGYADLPQNPVFAVEQQGDENFFAVVTQPLVEMAIDFRR